MFKISNLFSCFKNIKHKHILTFKIIFIIRDRLRNSKMNRSKEIEIENLRLLRKLQHVKPTLNKKEWVRTKILYLLNTIFYNDLIFFKEKDFVLHQSIVHSHNKKIYTPRGIGHRKYVSLDNYFSISL